MAPKKVAKKRVAAKGFKLPDPLPSGLILTDVFKKQWQLGKSIGQGGFGEIYLASDITTRPVAPDSNFVVKIEPHSNGPLFTEMHCYMRIAKPEYIESWKKSRKLKHLGMPKFFGSGSHEYKGQKYRFMVMERFGEDLQKIIDKHSKMFSYKTVFQVMIQILDVLEYIHFHGYIHADIKASNLLVGHLRNMEGFVYLVDYGLACRYIYNGKHKEYKYDQRKAHDGTIEFTSRDAHIGAHSRRGDLEILGYNLVQWLCGKLPWEDKLQDCQYVANKKRALMEDIPKFMTICFPDGMPPGIQEYMEYIGSLTFDETPDYEKCKAILREGLKRRGHKDDGKLVFLSATPKTTKDRSKKVSNTEESEMLKSDSEEADLIAFKPVLKKRKVTPKRKATVDASSNGDVSAAKKSRTKKDINSPQIPLTKTKIAKAKAKIIKNENEIVEDSSPKPANSKAKLRTSSSKVTAAKAKSGTNSRGIRAKNCKNGVTKATNTKDFNHNAYDNPTPAMLAIINKYKN